MDRLTKVPWRTVLQAVAIVLVPLEIADAFFLEVPVTAVLFAVLLAAGAVWLRRPGRGPVLLVGTVCALQVLLVVVFFGLAQPDPPPSSAEVALGALLGTVGTIGIAAAAGALRSGAGAERAQPWPQ